MNVETLHDGRYEALYWNSPIASFVCHFEHKTGMFATRNNDWDREKNQLVNGAYDSSTTSSAERTFHIGPEHNGDEVRMTGNGPVFVKSDRDIARDWYLIDGLQYRRLVDYYARGGGYEDACCRYSGGGF
jgi:hypothetical protein